LKTKGKNEKPEGRERPSVFADGSKALPTITSFALALPCSSVGRKTNLKTKGTKNLKGERDRQSLLMDRLTTPYNNTFSTALLGRLFDIGRLDDWTIRYWVFGMRDDLFDSSTRLEARQELQD
jgi:hypothetical protein